jgi:hypothetical protein
MVLQAVLFGAFVGAVGGVGIGWPVGAIAAFMYEEFGVDEMKADLLGVATGAIAVSLALCPPLMSIAWRHEFDAASDNQEMYIIMGAVPGAVAVASLLCAYTVA